MSRLRCVHLPIERALHAILLKLLLDSDNVTKFSHGLSEKMRKIGALN